MQPGQDPADAVEEFTRQANAAGHGIDGEGMTQMMEFFCEQKACERLQLQLPAPEQPLTLEVNGVGTAVVQPGQDPADAVEEFVKQANAAGHSIDGEGMVQMMEVRDRRLASLRLAAAAAGCGWLLRLAAAGWLLLAAAGCWLLAAGCCSLLLHPPTRINHVPTTNAQRSSSANTH